MSGGGRGGGWGGGGAGGQEGEGGVVWVSTTSSSFRCWPADVAAACNGEPFEHQAGSEGAGEPSYSGSLNSPPGSSRRDLLNGIKHDEEVAEEIPFFSAPLVEIKGTPPLIKSVALNGRRHVLTQDTEGQVKLWEVTRGTVIKSFGEVSFEQEEKQLFEMVSVAPWFSTDTKLGCLSLHLDSPQCFAAEVYATDLDVADVADDFKINLGEQTLRGMFAPWLQKIRNQDNSSAASGLEAAGTFPQEMGAEGRGRVGGGGGGRGGGEGRGRGGMAETTASAAAAAAVPLSSSSSSFNSASRGGANSNSGSSSSSSLRNERLQRGEAAATRSTDASPHAAAGSSAAGGGGGGGEAEAEEEDDEDDILANLPAFDFSTCSSLSVIAEGPVGGPWRSQVASIDWLTAEEMQWMPRWLVDCLLSRKLPQREPTKCGFFLQPLDPSEKKITQSKLSAPRILRLVKVKAYVKERLGLDVEEKEEERGGSGGGGGRGDGQGGGRNGKGREGHSARSSVGSGAGRVDVEILCNNEAPSLDLSLATVKAFIWKKPEDLVLHYRVTSTED